MFVTATGAYLTWYWYSAITERSGDTVVGRVDRWQSDLVNFLQRQGVWNLVVVFAAVIGAGVLYVWIWPRVTHRSNTGHVDSEQTASDEPPAKRPEPGAGRSARGTSLRCGQVDPR